MYKYTFIVLVALLSLGCLAQPSNDKVCSDGHIVRTQENCGKITFSDTPQNPDSYLSINLSPNQTNYAKAFGEINTSFDLHTGEWAFIDISYYPNYSINGHLMYDYLLNPGSPSSIKYTLLGNDSVGVNLTAPRTPGKYLLSVSKRGQTGPEIHLESYNLTVIDNVQNVTQAYEIANLFMYDALLAEHGVISNWNVTNQSVDMGDNLNVILDARFDVCGVDWERNDCVRGYTAEGNFTISKRTGQIIG